MATVIPNSKIEKHHVDKYNFKVIAMGSEETKEAAVFEESVEQTPVQAAKEIDSSALDAKSKESLIESLMKKTDEMSSNFIKLQMKLEAKEEEYQASLAQAKEEAFAEGMKAGKAQALEEIDKTLNEKMELFTKSIAKLDQSAQEYNSALESLKNELVTAALDISKEVIKIELSTNSSEVAKMLSEELIHDLQGASEVTLKVNPKDHATLSEHFGNLQYVTVIADSAVSEGGVIVVSDAGNIDAQISKRFERVKKAALSE
ncbi:flagellar assembly protein FliH [Sulfurimonas paralvinellae]|uniref:Flagellar assembly protein FliH n=1 Tax=Sulfurimonas paralvinellae TaxID=317658 RepID=A0A7M1B9A0_9BACT|nr:flagellar assembly protein FliH [Sulfurimonas paralvinellae]QOP46211.1 flagellar assembly protein FliH [Sulfurimonas paralvinellae]